MTEYGRKAKACTGPHLQPSIVSSLEPTCSTFIPPFLHMSLPQHDPGLDNLVTREPSIPCMKRTQGCPNKVYRRSHVNQYHAVTAIVAVARRWPALLMSTTLLLHLNSTLTKHPMRIDSSSKGPRAKSIHHREKEYAGSCHSFRHSPHTPKP